VGVRQPAKEFGQLAIFFWPSDKMPVVGNSKHKYAAENAAGPEA
jgi:hypothetical protein